MPAALAVMVADPAPRKVMVLPLTEATSGLLEAKVTVWPEPEVARRRRSGSPTLAVREAGLKVMV